jgi:hypothetical protein
VEEARDAVDARGALAAEDLFETPAEDLVDLVDARAGMAAAVCLFVLVLVELARLRLETHLGLSEWRV